MAFTVSSVIDEIVERYRDLPRARALSYLQQVHTDLLTESRIVADFEDVTLVAGTRVYALDPDILKIWSGELRASATESADLAQISVRELDRYEEQWHQASLGQPAAFYQEASSAGARQIGIYPVPDAVAIAAFPNLRLYVSRNQVLAESPGAGVVTSLPESVFDNQVYKSGVWLRHSRARHQQDLAEHLQEFLAEKAKLKGRLTNLLADVYPQNNPFFRQLTRPV